MHEIVSFIQFHEMSPANIATFWKVIQTLVIALLAIFGYAVYSALSIALASFEGNCAIGATLMMVDYQSIDFLTTRWEQATDCHVCIYIPATSCASAIIMFAILYASGSLGGISSRRNVIQPWIFVLPNILYSMVMFVASCYAIGVLESGLNGLCKSFQDRTGSGSCSALWSYLPLELRNAVKNGYLYDPYVCFTAARVGSWALIWLWLSSIVLSLVRICYGADFRLVKISLFREPQKITHLGQEPSEVYIPGKTVPQNYFQSMEESHWLRDVNWSAALREEILPNDIKAFRLNNKSGVTPRVVQSMESVIPSKELEKTRDATVQTSPSLFRVRRVKLRLANRNKSEQENTIL